MENVKKKTSSKLACIAIKKRDRVKSFYHREAAKNFFFSGQSTQRGGVGRKGLSTKEKITKCRSGLSTKKSLFCGFPYLKLLYTFILHKFQIIQNFLWTRLRSLCLIKYSTRISSILPLPHTLSINVPRKRLRH